MQNHITIEISPSQVENIVESLPLDEKIRLVRRLNLETWQVRFKELLSTIDRRLKRRRLSNEKITHIVKEVRARNYAQSRH